MQQPGLPLAQAPQIRRRGRPPGARNKGSGDLARYVEAMFGGMTPGQQAAELAMVKPADLKRAKAEARELQIPDLDLPPLMLAMVVKAVKLAAALGVDRDTAWVMLQKERADLMPYVHQRQAPKVDTGKVQAPAMAYLIPDGEAAQLADFSAADPDADELEILQVGQPKSDDEA